MAEAKALSQQKARLVQESESQREQLHDQCRNLEFAAVMVEKGHKVAVTALQATKRLSPAVSFLSKKSWLTPTGLIQNAQTLMGLVATVRNAFAPRASRVCIEEDDADIEIQHTRRF